QLQLPSKAVTFHAGFPYQPTALFIPRPPFLSDIFLFNIMQINSMNGISEQDLLKGVNEKHELMFKHFYECYYRITVSRAFAMIRNMEVSEEFVNDIFIKLWEKKLHFPDLKALLSYLYRAVKRKC